MKKILLIALLFTIIASSAWAGVANQAGPIFLLTPKHASVMMTAADTDRDGSGDSLFTLFTAGANGARLDGVIFTSSQASAAANSAMVCRVYVTDTSAANPMLRAEVVLPAITASNTVIGSTATVTFSGGLYLAPGQVIKVAQSIYAGVQDKLTCCTVGAGDY
jgi:hypothetical protein